MINGADLIAIYPQIVIGIGILLLLVLESFVKGAWPRGEVTGLFLIVAFVSLIAVQSVSTPRGLAFGGLLLIDPFSLFFSALIIGGGLLALMLSIRNIELEGIDSTSEYYVLFLTSILGALIFVCAGEFVTLFLGLEMMSLALYCMCGSAIRIRASTESAIKYFLLGSFASAFLLYGLCILYGLTGSTSIVTVQQVIAQKALYDSSLFLFAIGLVIVGFAFKIAAFPFHFWAPDVYQGAPSAVTGYMSTVIKAAAFGALLRVLTVSTEITTLVPRWAGAIWIISLFTMTFGNLVALRQRSIKRMLAYSSISHAGYMLTGLLAPGEFGGSAALLFYLVTYTIMTLGAFGVVMAVTDKHSSENHPDDISRFNGIGYSSPFLGIAMTVFMVSLAGLPPGFAGMLGKFYLFNSIVKANYIGLAIVGVINSAISVYYYLRVLVAMYFVESKDAPKFIPIGIFSRAAISFCFIGTVILGLMPSYLHDIALRAIQTLR